MSHPGHPARQRRQRPLVPHPDDEAEVRAGLDESDADEVLPEREAEEYLRRLLAEPAEEQ